MTTHPIRYLIIAAHMILTITGMLLCTQYNKMAVGLLLIVSNALLLIMNLTKLYTDKHNNNP